MSLLISLLSGVSANYVPYTGATAVVDFTSYGVKGFAPTNYQTGTSYTLVLTDAGKRISMTNASASTLTVPPASSVPFVAETELLCRQGGAGQVTPTAGAGVTINIYNSLTKSAGQTAYFSLKLNATANNWDCFGNLA